MRRASIARSSSTPSLGSRRGSRSRAGNPRVRDSVREALSRAARRGVVVPPTQEAGTPPPEGAHHHHHPPPPAPDPSPASSAGPASFHRSLLPPTASAASDAPRKHARKNMLLACLEFTADGACAPRSVTRQDVLDLARARATGSPAAPRLAVTRIDRETEAPRSFPLKNAVRGGRPRGRGLMPPLSAGFLKSQSARQHRSRNALTMRDLRQVDPDFTAKPALWVREHALVVSLEKVRSIVFCDRMFLFDPHNEAVQGFVKYLRRYLAAGAEGDAGPFEFRALEAILEHVCYNLSRNFGEIKPDIQHTLELLPDKINTEHLERLRSREHALKSFYVRSRKVQHVLQSLLDQDDDMADMYLTEKSGDTGLARNPLHHNEAETLLETHLQTVDDLTSKAELLNRAIDDTEDLIEIHLDTMQNRLLLVDLIISAISTILSFGGMVTAIFGMNLQLPHQMRFLPSSAYYFYGTVSATSVAMAISILFVVRWCHRLNLRSTSNSGKGRWRRRKGDSQQDADDVPEQDRMGSVRGRDPTIDEALARLAKKPS